MLIEKGSTRIVFVLRNVAIKIPNFTFSWQNFIAGILANIREFRTWNYNSGPLSSGKEHLLCPVLWCSWGGWILVMKKVDKVLTHEEYWALPEGSVREHVKNFPGDDSGHNYGYLEGRIVKIDYGTH